MKMLPYSDKQRCKVSQQVLQYFLPQVAVNYTPLQATGDGNCLYNSVSLSLIASERLSRQLRLMVVIEVILNRGFYLQQE